MSADLKEDSNKKKFTGNNWKTTNNPPPWKRKKKEKKNERNKNRSSSTRYRIYDRDSKTKYTTILHVIHIYTFFYSDKVLYSTLSGFGGFSANYFLLVRWRFKF